MQIFLYDHMHYIMFPLGTNWFGILYIKVEDLNIKFLSVYILLLFLSTIQLYPILQPVSGLLQMSVILLITIVY